MNRKMLMAQLKALGFKGDESLDAMLKFVADEGITLTLKDGTPIDVKKAFEMVPKGKKVVVGVTADGGEDVEIVHGRGSDDESEESEADNTDSSGGDDNTDGKHYNLAEARRADEAEKAARRAGNGEKFNRGMAGILSSQRAPAFLNNADRKNYQRKIDRGEAKFNDVDHAEHFGAIFRLAYNHDQHKDCDYGQKRRDMEIVGKAGLNAINTASGALVDPEYSKRIIWMSELYGAARRVGTIYPMTSNEWIGKRRTSIVTFRPTAEGATSTPQNNAYDNLTLNARKFLALVEDSNELYEDAAVNIADDYATAFSEGINLAMDDAFFNGDGGPNYNNFVGLESGLNAGAYINASGAGWASHTPADLLGLAGKVVNVGLAGERMFVSSQQYFDTILGVRDAATNQFKDLIGGPIRGSDASFRGYPWYFAQVMPTVTDSTAGTVHAYFGCIRDATALGIRNELRVADSDHYGFAKDTKAGDTTGDGFLQGAWHIAK